ncbi:MAG: M20/M25/M40 family metallo-hydrolase [Planctomycetota bacterium]
MKTLSLDEILELILKNPTAPYREAAVLRAIDTFAKERAPRVTLTIDAAGNRILNVRGSSRAPQTPTIAFTAHVDHPALVPDSAGRFELLGRVYPAARLAGGKICYYRENGEPAGTGVIKSVEEAGSRIFTNLSRAGGEFKTGDYAAFDFPYLQYDGDRIVGRVCDDLLGAVSILASVEEILTKNADLTFLAIFTRAEEVGFVGALAMLENPFISKTLPIVGLECSAARGGNATIGDGPIVRVGDRIATFDPAISAFLRDCAEELVKGDTTFRYQRRLMQGGACESTAYQLDGRPAGAMCLALGNYHNIPDPDPDDATTGLAPEFVSKNDLIGLVKLMTRSVERSANLSDPWQPTRESLAKRLAASRSRLHESGEALKS